MINLDLYLFNLINGLAGKWLWLDYVEIFFAQYFEWFLWLILILFLVINIRKNWRMFLEAFVSAIITKFVLAEIIRWIWFRPRPFVSLNFIPFINQSAEESAFPSGHASFYFALSTIVYIYNKKVGIAFYIATILITFARIFTGVHWPSDILAGAGLGILTAWIVNKIFKKIKYKNINN